MTCACLLRAACWATACRAREQLPRDVERLRHAEVRHDRGARVQEDVVGLDVAVHDATLVGIRERASDVTQDADGVHDAHRATAGDARAKRLALHERHHEIRPAGHLAGAQHGDDVRVLQTGDDEDLAAKALRVHVGHELRRQHLHYHSALERTVVGDEHARHAAAAELALDGEGGAQGVAYLFGQ